MNLEDLQRVTGVSAVCQVVEFSRLDPLAVAPKQAYPGDAGWDLAILHETRWFSGERKEVRTGLAIHVPEGHYGRVTGRSSAIRRHGLHVYEGVADSGFRGEWTMCVENRSASTVRLGAGTFLAQLIISPFTSVEWQEVDELLPSERGARGYGSSG